ncbi:MAG: PAS domain S-box protein [Bacteroidales bacterium]|jgi:PAS domain S-box-containing protein|nr:PAS domain S-box protein [Bacteroidales bacterium]
MENLEDKTKEQLLKESEEKYRGLYNSIRDSILVADTNRNIIECNPAFYELFGYSKDEIIGKQTVYIYENESEFKALGEALKQHYGDAPFLKTVNYKKKSGEVFPGETNVFYLKDDNGEVNGFIGLIRDITEREQADKALLDSEEKYHLLYDNTPMSYQSLNKDGTIKNTNPAWLKTLGYTQEEVVGKYFGDLLHPDHKAHFEKNFPAFKKRGYVHGVMFKIRHKDGHYLDISFEGRIGYLPDGSFKQTYCVFEDITERKKAEKEIKRFSRIFEDSFNEIFLFDAKTFIFTEVNNAAQKNLGYSMEELQKMTPLDFKPEFTSESFAKLVEPLRTGEKEKIVFETVHQRKDQSLYNVEVHLQLLHFEQEDLFVAIILDISERKQIETNLKNSEEKFRRAFITSPDSININRLSDGLYVEINSGFTKIMGYSEYEVIGKASTELNIWANPSDRNKLIAGLQANVLVENLEAKFRTKNGELKDGLMSANIIELNNEPHILSITRDITERKKAEEELAKYREHLEELIKERTQEVDEKNKKLSDQMKIFVGREIKIRDLENKIKGLQGK